MRLKYTYVLLALLAVGLLLGAGCTTPTPPATPTPTSTPTPTDSPSATMTMTMTILPTTATAPPTGTTDPATTTMPPSGGAVTVGLMAKNIAFNTTTITVPACSAVTVNFDNQDSGIPHNFAVFTTSAATTPIFQGQIITGPKTTQYRFTAPCTPGDYWFRCDVHPSIMFGTFKVV
jgi:plastocyanin